MGCSRKQQLISFGQIIKAAKRLCSAVEVDRAELERAYGPAAAAILNARRAARSRSRRLTPTQLAEPRFARPLPTKDVAVAEIRRVISQHVAANLEALIARLPIWLKAGSEQRALFSWALRVQWLDLVRLRNDHAERVAVRLVLLAAKCLGVAQPSGREMTELMEKAGFDVAASDEIEISNAEGVAGQALDKEREAALEQQSPDGNTEAGTRLETWRKKIQRESDLVDHYIKQGRKAFRRCGPSAAAALRSEIRRFAKFTDRTHVAVTAALRTRLAELERARNALPPDAPQEVADHRKRHAEWVERWEAAIAKLEATGVTDKQIIDDELERIEKELGPRPWEALPPGQAVPVRIIRPRQPKKRRPKASTNPNVRRARRRAARAAEQKGAEQKRIDARASKPPKSRKRRSPDRK